MCKSLSIIRDTYFQTWQICNRAHFGQDGIALYVRVDRGPGYDNKTCWHLSKKGLNVELSNKNEQDDARVHNCVT